LLIRNDVVASPAAEPPAASGAKRLAAGALEVFIVDPQSAVYSRAAGALKEFTATPPIAYKRPTATRQFDS